MKTNFNRPAHTSTVKAILIVLAGLALLISAGSALSLAAPAPLTQAGSLLLTPTPTPQAEPGPAPAGAPADLQQLTAEVQKLAALSEALKTEISNLQAQISALQTQISDLQAQVATLVAPAPPPNPTVKTLEELGGQPCPDDSAFTCVTLTVPLDHFDPANRETLEVVFGVLPATGERKGMFVVATGGPGSAGLTSADPYVASYDPSIPEYFDIVFFDQRGVGQSGGLTCPKAAATYYEADVEAKTPAGEAATIAAAETFTTACLSELGSPNKLLPYLGTHQAVEDLELFREAIGDDKFWLYGESYGTQYAQTYAAAHPDHLAGLLLDGTVDLTLSGPEFLQEQAQAFNDVLVLTLKACNDDEECAADMGGRDAVAVYDELAAKLAAEPLPFKFPLPSGSAAEREFSFVDLETAAANNLYSEGGRLLFQRALAAAARSDDLAPLARLLYDALSLDPETLEAVPDPTYSDAIYYGVECVDYDYSPGDPAQDAESYIRAGDAVDKATPRLSSIFYGDLPCAFWPFQAGPRPEPLQAEGIPTLVLNATADPATPLANAQRVYSRLADGYLITMTGGPHIIFAWGNACPDDMVTAFLVEGKMPEQRETTCEGVVAKAYVPLAPADAGAFESPLEALLSADTEINYLPEYYYWDAETPTSVGCPFGGTLAFEPGDDGDEFTLADCAFSAGFTMTGSGLYSYDDASFTLDVEVTGPAGVAGDLAYERNENGAIHVTGEYGGEKVDLSEE